MSRGHGGRRSASRTWLGFVTPDLDVNVPLEATYRAACEGVPRYHRRILEGPR